MDAGIQGIMKDFLLGVLDGSGEQSENNKNGSGGSGGGHGLSGAKGIAAGAGAAALAPLALKSLGNVAKALGIDDLTEAVKSPGDALGDVTSNLGDKLKSGIGEKVEEAGGPSGMLKDAVKGAMPGGGGGKGGVDGVGKGRRMPVQQSVDIGAPIETVYNQWTQFEDWPTFMHRVTRVTQEDDCTVSFATKIWGKTKEFTANIETQRPNERIKWKVSQGLTHTGVVTFHELGPNLTRVLLSLDVQPGSLIEKAARGMRHVKRAARADLHRFKALIEMAGEETGAWRGVIEEGEVVEEHDPSYDEERDYADLDEMVHDDEQDEDEDEDEDEDKDEDKGRSQARRRQSRSGSENGDRSGRSSGAQRSRSSSGAQRSRSSSGQKSRGSSGQRSGGSSGQRSRSSSSQRSRSSSAQKSGGGGRSPRAKSSGESRSSGSGTSRRRGSQSSGSRSSGDRSGSRSRSRSASGDGQSRRRGSRT